MTWRQAARQYIRQYRLHRAQPISQAPPSLQLHARTLVRNGLSAQWDVGRYGYYLEKPKEHP